MSLLKIKILLTTGLHGVIHGVIHGVKNSETPRSREIGTVKLRGKKSEIIFARFRPGQ